MIKKISIGISVLIANVAFADLATDTAIYNAHTVCANSLGTSAAILNTLGRVRSDRDKNNLNKILINLNLVLAELSKELANKAPNITNIQRRTDEAERLAKTGKAILKIALNGGSRRVTSSESRSMSNSNTNTATAAAQISLREVFRQIVGDEQEPEQVASVVSGFSLRDVFNELIRSEAAEDNTLEDAEEENGFSLQDVFNELIRSETAEDNTLEDAEEENGLSLQDIFKSLIKDRDDKAASKVTPESDTTESISENIGLQEIFKAIVDQLESLKEVIPESPELSKYGLKDVFSAIIQEEDQ